MNTHGVRFGISQFEKLQDREVLHSGINVSYIRVGGGIVGLVFSIGTVLIFLVGIPALRWFPVGAVLAGAAVSLALRFVHKIRPADPIVPILH